jgi:acyl-CoA dehydrogenase
MGMDGMETCDVIFEDCRVPASALLGGVEGNGFRTSMSAIDKGRLNIAAMCVGVAERLIRDMVRYAMERRQFGEPIANFQLIQAMIADSEAEAYAARSMVLDAAQRRDAGERVTRQAACAKLFASEMVGRVADRAVQIHGAAGYMAEYPVERLYRDVRLFRIFEGTSQIQQLVIARETLKAAARSA